MSCTLGSLADSAAATVTLTPSPTATGTVTATAVADATESDADDNNLDAENTTVANGLGCTITGTNGNDILNGGNSADVICGLAGNDTYTAATATAPTTCPAAWATTPAPPTPATPPPAVNPCLSFSSRWPGGRLAPAPPGPIREDRTPPCFGDPTTSARVIMISSSPGPRHAHACAAVLLPLAATVLVVLTGPAAHAAAT